MAELDKLDVDLLRLIAEEPRAGVREYARRLNIARNTATSRIAKLEQLGVIVGWRPQMDLAPLGYEVTSFVHVWIAQSQLEATLGRLARIPELIEANTVSGDGDLLCRLVAHNNSHFEEVLQKVQQLEGVQRVRSEIVLNRRIWPRVIPLIEKVRSDM
ncbi:Lrp/AsnC family transcriptional regulator [Gordonia hydrophobica]|uniref:Lrp/AsnC family transcriptional regulator n=1 Tax=Gordonia hydrophobica TaxID=40516 RepID=A0ABZ2U4Z3_9ACTN|nr:Lrp/AsnC family transcriptional regulator [Gordonia hydrophobica]MBM7366725.1 DNA-binding Lrp family transcriptional regulator [Gordonia hydrophobica]